MATFDFAIQVDVGFLLDNEGTSVSPRLSRVYQVGEEFPAVILPIVGDCFEVTLGFTPEVTSRMVGADLVFIQVQGGPFLDTPRWDEEQKRDRTMQGAIIDALKASGFR